MRARWLVVLAIVLWFAYGAFSPRIAALYDQHRGHVRFLLCVALCAFVLLTPSFDTLLRQNRGVLAHFVQHLRGAPAVERDRIARILEGTYIANPASAAIAAAVAPAVAAAVAPTAPPPARLSDLERRTVAARQQWKCGKCREPFQERYLVWVPTHAACADLSTALCPACYASVVARWGYGSEENPHARG